MKISRGSRSIETRLGLPGSQLARRPNGVDFESPQDRTGLAQPANLYQKTGDSGPLKRLMINAFAVWVSLAVPVRRDA